jgi:hypothetical protein
MTEGGSPLVLATVNSTEEGTFTLTGVVVPEQTILMRARNCEEVGPVFPTVSGIPSSRFADMVTGDTLSGEVVRYLDSGGKDAMEASLLKLGAEFDLDTTGMVIGIVRSTEGEILGGATVDCGDGCTAYYGDASPEDGQFGTDDVPGDVTSVDGGGYFIAPGGAGKSFTGTLEGYTVNTFFTLNLPAVALIVNLTATPAE